MMCSHCGVNQATSTHRWCRECKAASQRVSRVTRSRRDYIRGFEAFREIAFQTLKGIGDALMTGDSAANVVRLVRFVEPENVARGTQTDIMGSRPYVGPFD